MVSFVGRQLELSRLDHHFQAVIRDGAGVLLSIRGRRQVGKSRLVEEFLRHAHGPSVFLTAVRHRPTADEIEHFTRDVATSSLEAALLVADTTFDGWEPFLRLVASTISSPTIIVIDELPFLLESDPSLEGVLQKVWDRYLSKVPVLVIVVGSDLSMMESLGRYDRPLYQRMREMVIDPLSPTETAQMLQLDPATALDAHLVHGGFPTLARAWQDCPDVTHFLDSQLTDATSPLVVVGERILNVEFPPTLQARTVLEAIGSGQTTFSAIGSRAHINQGSLTRALDTLINDKRVIAVDRPLSAKPSRNALYRVADPYLRFWLRFIGPGVELLHRGRGDVLAAQIADSWSVYRGQAIEPVVRASLERLLPDERLGDARFVGSYWTRTNDVEVDLVGGREANAPTSISFVGSLKWRERSQFDRHDLAALASARSRVPGADSCRMIGISRSGFATADLDAALTPDDLIDAWKPHGSSPDGVRSVR